MILHAPGRRRATGANGAKHPAGRCAPRRLSPFSLNPARSLRGAGAFHREASHRHHQALPGREGSRGPQDAPLEACGVCEVKGYGRQKSYLDEYRGSEYSAAFLPKVELSLWVDDLRVEEVVRVIVDIARTGRMGDGKIFVMPAMPGGGWDGEA